MEKSKNSTWYRPRHTWGPLTIHTCLYLAKNHGESFVLITRNPHQDSCPTPGNQEAVSPAF